ncbi:MULTISPECIES: type II and III secretion system protein family protein [unclassified Bradyrhizobium]|uniref:type II and III secretion system protein family protein n=1 Tax=unclassified Bradyrhizobium TaxID=2631580 RepID=UPI00247ABE8B|nr:MULTISPECIES: type II and III secretion system protein family protein [unclassified Bradyrhizobium]WGS02816.1 type II and III secretion system protein family protein [Bradyrhizobium sp. ISRA436]WGS09703.1 type II and III secretion system protein family protein [Bradyrhizobium sp. ISRA437]WGS16586.1 type II and III secretion system protein family protein [Bradyrhizobium sp. ISRA443]WGS31338.1 type II and III secretion system protein family protein [Bradyrhizobium sp. ISRA464]
MIAVPYISCAAALLFPLCAAAQTQRDGVQRAARATADSLNGTLDLASSQGKTIHLPAPAASIFVADPAIADYQAPSNTTIFVFGKKSGRTSLFALNDNGEALAELRVVVRQPVEDLRAALKAELGDYPIQVSYTPRGAILSGTAPNADVVDAAKKVTEQFLGAGALVVNKVQVAGSLQVNLSVRIAEVSRSAMKELGVNLSVSGQNGTFVFGFSRGGPSSTAAARGGGTANIGFGVGGANISAVLDALASEHLASVLAEPNLTAMSGESASFLAGGEFPIPVMQDNRQVSVQFRQFGISLEFVPTVLSNNQINIHVKPEVSELSKEGEVSVNGISVPGLSTRRASTVVELASGQSFAIGGLIRRNFNTDIGAFPWLGDVPILGALFRSSSFQKQETELVIVVTPYIVRPASNPGKISAPTGRIGPPSDAGRTLTNTLASSPRGRTPPPMAAPGTAGGAGFIIE